MADIKKELKDRMESEGFGKIDKSIKTEKPIIEIEYIKDTTPLPKK